MEAALTTKLIVSRVMKMKHRMDSPTSLLKQQLPMDDVHRGEFDMEPRELEEVLADAPIIRKDVVAPVQEDLSAEDMEQGAFEKLGAWM